VEVTGGKLTTSLSTWAADRAVGGLDDSTIHGIIVKAMAGICQLLAALAASAHGDVVLPGSVTLTTTKNAEKACTQLAGWGGRVRLDKRVLTHYAPALTRRSYKTRLLSCDVAVYVHHGLRWVNDCAPPGLGESMGPLVGRAAALLSASGGQAAAAGGGGQQGCVVM
jgi:hypothetical protein